jgi:hypothetical protein
MLRSKMPKDMFLIPMLPIYLIKTLSTRPLVLTHHYRMVLLNARIDTYLMLPKLSYFICMCPNVFGVMQSSLHVISPTTCLALSLMDCPLTPCCFLPLKSFLCLEFSGVFVMSTILDLVLTNLILAPLSVFLGYSQT